MFFRAHLNRANYTFPSFAVITDSNHVIIYGISKQKFANNSFK